MVSLDTLDAEKKEILTQFLSITQTEDLDEALGQLIEHNWNLERAVQHVYENNTTSEKREELEQEVASSTIIPPAATSTTTSSTARAAAVNHNSNLYPSSTIHNTFRTQHQSTTRRRPTTFLSLLFWPFGIAWNLTWSILSLASRILLSRPAITSDKKPRDPRVLAYEFNEAFEEKYGRHHVEFFIGGYSQALEKARKDLLFMLVILLSEDHDDTPAFCRDTLTSTRVIDFLKEKNVLVWGGNVRESEAHKVSYALQASAYPFMALIALQGHSTPKMTVIERIEGPSHPEELVSQIEIAMDRHGAVVNKLKNERSQRDYERQLVKDQDDAYHQSLKADQEKARIAQEEKEAQERAEAQARQEQKKLELLAKKREHYIKYLYTTLPEEPTDGKVANINFRLADGDRVVRKFRQDDTIDALYRFVEIYPLMKQARNNEPVEKVEEAPADYVHQYKFTIHSPYPRMEYEPHNESKLCDVKSLWPSAALVVDAVDDEEEDTN